MGNIKLDDHAQGIAGALQLLMGDLQDHEKRAIIYAAFPDSFVVLLKADDPTPGADYTRAQIKSILQRNRRAVKFISEQMDGQSLLGAAAQHELRAHLSVVGTHITTLSRIFGLET